MEVEEEAVEEVEAEGVTEEAEGGTLLQEDHPQVIQPVEETIDSLDNPQTYSWEIAPRRRSSSHNGNYTTT